jgi:Fanconi anemia group I protein
MVSTAPLFMLDSVGKVREVFDCLPMLLPDTAQGLLVALLPLLKVSMSLKDTLILLLRKSIFSRLESVRNYMIWGATWLSG